MNALLEWGRLRVDNYALTIFVICLADIILTSIGILNKSLVEANPILDWYGDISLVVMFNVKFVFINFIALAFLVYAYNKDEHHRNLAKIVYISLIVILLVVLVPAYTMPELVSSLIL